jgi:hypothetical protein
MQGMTQRIRFLLGRGGAVATAPQPALTPPLVTAPTASARRSAAQPKAKGGKSSKGGKVKPSSR